MINIDELIQNTLKQLSAAKAKDENTEVSKLESQLKTYRNIKAAFTTFTTAKNAKVLDEAAQIQIIKKLISQSEESLSAFKEARRDNLICEAVAEIETLKSFVPETPDMAQIESFYFDWRGNDLSDLEFPKIHKKNMGTAIKAIKEHFPMADGKTVSEVVKKYVV
jgi:uncharacterized protein YqeY